MSQQKASRHLSTFQFFFPPTVHLTDIFSGEVQPESCDPKQSFPCLQDKVAAVGLPLGTLWALFNWTVFEAAARVKKRQRSPDCLLILKQQAGWTQTQRLRRVEVLRKSRCFNVDCLQITILGEKSTYILQR